MVAEWPNSVPISFGLKVRGYIFTIQSIESALQFRKDMAVVDCMSSFLVSSDSKDVKTTINLSFKYT